jgi:hypothetical protein
MEKYYTYAYLREDGTPYYIGKGCGYRINSNKGRPCNRPKDKSKVIFLKQNLTEEEAFKHEKYMIAVLGRKDLGTGILRNMTDGGEGCAGFKHSEESKIKMGTSKGRKYWNNGIKTIRSVNYPGEGWVKGRLYVKNQSRKGWYFWNNGIELKYSKECPGEEWVRGTGKLVKRYGKKYPYKNGCSTKGLQWWNDGIKNTMKKECPGEGWVKGRLKSKDSRTGGTGGRRKVI